MGDRGRTEHLVSQKVLLLPGTEGSGRAHRVGLDRDAPPFGGGRPFRASCPQAHTPVQVSLAKAVALGLPPAHESQAELLKLLGYHYVCPHSYSYPYLYLS